MRRLLTLLVALLGGSGALGCALLGQQVVIVTPTPSPPPTATFIVATSTPIPSPTPIPTPTVAPFVAIHEANTALLNGDYDAAVKVYRTVLEQSALAVDPSLRTEAAFGLGVAALREGLFADAVSALTSFVETHTDEVRVARAYFLRGDAHLGLSEWDKAIADFREYLRRRPGVIDSYAHERIGDSYLALGNTAEALKSYDQAVASSRGLAPLMALREKLAAGYLNVGQVGNAVAQYDAILEDARNAGYRASIALAAAQALDNAGNSALALARYQDIVASYPESVAGYRAMQALLQAGTSIDHLQRARLSFVAEDYNDVITALHNYTTDTPIAKIDPVVYMMLGRAYRELGNFQAANTAFETILSQYPTTAYFGDAWLEQGRTLFVAGQIDAAIERYQKLAEAHPDVLQAAEALWRAGYLYSTQGALEQSLATFEILGTKYPNTTQAMDGLFRAGMAALNQGMNARAQRLFALLANGGSGELKAAGYLWLGRLYQLDNQPEQARLAYAEAANADPGGYYSLRAGDLLNGRAPFVPPPRLDWAYNTPEYVAQAEQWMRERFSLTAQGVLWPLSAELAADPRLVRGGELFAVAAYDDAIGEFTALTDDNRQNPLALYQLATHFQSIGLYRQSIEAAARLIDLAQIRTVEAPKYIAALRFPIAYHDLVLPEAEKYKLDPLLVFSLIRQESLFQGVATSSAQAQGLMQIIPDTGAYIAMKLGWPNFQNSDLYRPHINVTFGIYYLAEQLQTFDGSVYAALAAYNGGPGNSAEWLRISNGDPDLFVQAITFDETRTYVRRIYEQYETYSAIYAAR
ncbi:MAG: tetratricopeptide repeat protein [Anaerolineae bacterium]|nr:tetratricopeptide repeat protein [Anaerolineae bacterium]